MLSYNLTIPQGLIPFQIVFQIDKLRFELSISMASVALKSGESSRVESR